MTRNKKSAPFRIKKVEKVGNILDLNKISHNDLVTKFHVSRKIAELIIKNRPYNLPEDIFEKKSLMEAIDPNNISILLTKSKHEKITEKIQRRTVFTNSFGVKYGYLEFNKTKRVFIESSFGKQLISAELIGKNFDIDYKTIRILGHHVYELFNLDANTARAENKILHDEESMKAGLLWKNIFDLKIDPDIRISIQKLSQLLLGLQEATAPLGSDKNKECKVDGCTCVPDFDIKDCCDEHDRCYWKGGTEADRLLCDTQFFNCIKNKGGLFHWILAWIYYAGVRVFGESHFNSTTVQDSKDIPTVSIPGNESKECCKVKISLEAVRYNGDNVGDDWKFIIKVANNPRNKSKRCTLPNGGFKSFTDVVFEGEYGKCNQKLSIPIWVSATEIDVGPDDTGNNKKDIEFTCINNQTIRTSITVEVTETIEGTAKLEFDFAIETKCEPCKK